MFKKILLGLVLLVVVLVIVIALQPSEYQVTRSITIAAPAGKIFPLVNDFKAWAQWSPWEKKDPEMKRTIEGAESGVGAIYRWAGNDNVGVGNMSIVESKPDELIRTRLEFEQPMAGVCSTFFKFEPEAAGTKVTWQMSGTNNFVGKAFSLIMNMDKMIGDDFEKGLSEMKKIAEQAAAD